MSVSQGQERGTSARLSYFYRKRAKELENENWEAFVRNRELQDKVNNLVVPFNSTNLISTVKLASAKKRFNADTKGSKQQWLQKVRQALNKQDTIQCIVRSDVERTKTALLNIYNSKGDIGHQVDDFKHPPTSNLDTLHAFDIKQTNVIDVNYMSSKLLQGTENQQNQNLQQVCDNFSEETDDDKTFSESVFQETVLSKDCHEDQKSNVMVQQSQQQQKQEYQDNTENVVKHGVKQYNNCEVDSGVPVQLDDGLDGACGQTKKNQGNEGDLNHNFQITNIEDSQEESLGSQLSLKNVAPYIDFVKAKDVDIVNDDNYTCQSKAINDMQVSNDQQNETASQVSQDQQLHFKSQEDVKTQNNTQSENVGGSLISGQITQSKLQSNVAMVPQQQFSFDNNNFKNESTNMEQVLDILQTNAVEVDSQVEEKQQHKLQRKERPESPLFMLNRQSPPSSQSPSKTQKKVVYDDDDFDF